MGGDAKSTQYGFRLPSVCRMKMIAAAKEGYAYLVPIRTGEEGEEVLPCKLGIGPDDVRFPQMLAHEIKARLVKGCLSRSRRGMMSCSTTHDRMPGMAETSWGTG